MFYAERCRLTSLAARDRLPAIYEVNEYAQEGVLMSYGPSFPEMHRRAATYADKILKGAKPGDLPMEQPTKFEFVIKPDDGGGAWTHDPTAGAGPSRRADPRTFPWDKARRGR